MKRLSWLFLGILLSHLALTFWTHRAVFLTPFDPVYWQERFEQSQWQLPSSKRVIGDDGLYLYAGWRLAHGDDPTSLNPEMPPLAKYLIGASLRLFGNGHLFAFGSGIAVLAVFYLLAKKLLKGSILAIAATALLALDPLFTSQIYQTMLDTTQSFFLLSFFLIFQTFFSASKKPRVFLAAGLGVVFGLFSASKLPLFAPILFLIAAGYFLKKKAILPLGIFLAAGAVSGFAAYGRYFALGHSLIDWLKVQKWVLDFYARSNLSANYGSALTTLLVNKYQNLFSRSWESSEIWSISWPVIATLSLWGFLKNFKRNRGLSPVWFAIAFFTLAVLLINTLIPFWPRYLMIILPFLYLGTFLTIKKLGFKSAALVLFLLVANSFVSWRLNFPTPQKDVEQIVYDWSQGFWSDLYRATTTATKNRFSREEFNVLGQRFFNEAEIEAVKIETGETHWSPLQSSQTFPITVTYFTRQLGPFSENKEFKIVKENGQWKIPWEWDWLIDMLTEDRHLETKVTQARRGSILHPDQSPLAEDHPGYLLSIIPEKVDTTKEAKMLAFLEEIFAEKLVAVNIHQRYVGANQPKWAVPIGSLPEEIVNANLKTLKAYPGIELSGQLTRTYFPNPTYNNIGDVANARFPECCSWLYSTTNYDGATGIEKEKNETLKGLNGGTLVIKNEKSEMVRKILDLQKKDGENFQL